MGDQREITDLQIAVLIDYENVGPMNIQPLFDYISNYGRVILKRAYADWSKAKNSRNQILEFGIDPIHSFHSPSKLKNTCDIRLTIDAMELLFTSSIDIFVIVSSDSDFVPLINKLRSLGKKVVGAGEKSKVADTLRISFDEYFEIEQKQKIQSGVSKSRKSATIKSVTPAIKKKSQTTTKPPIDDALAQQIDKAWSNRVVVDGKPIPGTKAAEDVLNILNIENLKASPYKNLQSVIKANHLLTNNWIIDKNKIAKKTIL